MSFTTVTALARDNGYALIILIAGTSIPLLRQSTRRLQSDLRIESRDDRAWLHLGSEDIHKTASKSRLAGAIMDWHDAAVASTDKKTVLITTMKQHTHLKKVIKALHALNLQGLLALVIDDEADQASLNTLVLKSDESTTYQQIRELRLALPHHTYLQYTATPQAPLLINIIDTLSPKFAEVLTPGPAYVGGLQFFQEVPGLVEIIPDGELPDANLEDAPESLLKALRLFLIGVAAGLLIGGDRGNRSMMIHPSQRTSGHSDYYRWVRLVWDTWKLRLDHREGSDDKLELLDDFREAHRNLSATVPDLPSFEEIAPLLQRSLRTTVIEEINAKSGPTPNIDWKSNYAWVLVGGQAMDRGFTVEGLTVTYMPRSKGIGNADTVQQRARFFGYKRGYLGYCRVFLERETLDAYKRYVEHEEDVRRRLRIHSETGAPLAEWKRRFFLDGELHPTRKSILDIPYSRASGDSQWYWTRVPHDSDVGIQSNVETVAAFLDQIALQSDPGSPLRSDYAKHRWNPQVPLRLVMEELLTRLVLSNPNDSSSFTLLQLMLSEHLEQAPEATCSVYEMSAGVARVRSLNAKGEITNLFQGADPSKPKGEVGVGDIYPGDRELGARERRPVVQIHRVDVKGGDGQIAYTDVPAIAVHVPEDIARDLLVQDQGST
ncbi:MAG: hypothetical protein JWM27_167 [Gemmatimonadetes bacterium]|nr:hypothetical protein [Gemmatimonadota bacterium]